MKASALLLILAFGALQGVSVTDCPCGSFCETKNSCPGEKHQSAPADDCCSRSGKPIENCFHLEPQTDLVVVPPEDAPVPIVDLGVVDPPPVPDPAAGMEFVDAEFGLPPPARGCPLFLLHSSLLL